MGAAVDKYAESRSAARNTHLTRREVLALSALGLVTGIPRSSFAANSEGQLTWGIHVSLAPTWFDPQRRRASSPRLWCFTRCTMPW